MKIKNWRKFQHFKDRRPPWIKLYRELLDDVDWHDLDPLAAKVLVMLWLIASEYDGELPPVRKLAFRLRMPEKQLNSIISTLSSWLEQIDITPISDRYQSDAPETETETETDIAPSALVKTDCSKTFLEFFSAYPKRKSKKDAEKAYKASRRDVSHETIMEGLRRAIASDPRFRDPQFTPYPASWLRAGGYEDQTNVLPLKLEAWS